MGVLPVVERQACCTVSPLRNFFLLDRHALLSELARSFRSEVLSFIGCKGFALEEIVTKLLLFFMQVVLAHVHEALKFSIRLQEVNAFGHAVISWLSSLQLPSLLESLMDLLPSLSPVLCHFIASLLWGLVPDLLGSQLQGIYLLFKILINFSVTNCSSYIPSTLLFVERVFFLVEIKLDFLTLAVDDGDATEHIVALLR